MTRKSGQAKGGDAVDENELNWTRQTMQKRLADPTESVPGDSSHFLKTQAIHYGVRPPRAFLQSRRKKLMEWIRTKHPLAASFRFILHPSTYQGRDVPSAKIEQGNKILTYRHGK